MKPCGSGLCSAMLRFIGVNMKHSIILASLMMAAIAAHAGVPEVLAAETAVIAAKAQVKALKASLTKVEKAELAVALATAKLAAAKE